MSLGLIVIQANDLQHLSFLHQGTTRLKVTCFDLCPSLIALGANSGTVYVLDHESLRLRHQVPTGNGCVVQLSIAPDESHIAYALSNGIVSVFETVAQEEGVCRHLIGSKEHLGKSVSSVVWAQNNSELYIGDSSGRVSVLYVPKSKTSSLFRSSSVHLMTLDSGVTQLDYSDGYLLVSTLTRSYLCNTTLETFTQIGTKLRQGEYGGCFCRVDPSGSSAQVGYFMKSQHEIDENVESTRSKDQSLSSSGQFGLSDCYEAIEDDHKSAGYKFTQEKTTSHSSIMFASRIFCARPGTRIWEVDHTGKVLVTHQLKGALMVPPADVLLIDSTIDAKNVCNADKAADSPELGYDVTAKSAEDSSNSDLLHATHPPVSVAFTKMLSFYNSYLIAISTYGLYVIDPSNSKVLLWVSVSEGVSDVKVSGNTLIYKTGNGSIQNYMITSVDIAVLVLHARGLPFQCAKLCIKYQDIFSKSEVLSRLGAKLLTELAIQIEDEAVRLRLMNIKKVFKLEDETETKHISFTKSETTYFSDNKYDTDVKESVKPPTKFGHQMFTPMSVTRWYSEPQLSKGQGKGSVSRRSAVSVETSPNHHPKRPALAASSSTFLQDLQSTLSLTHYSSEDTLQSLSSAKSLSGLSSASLSSGRKSRSPVAPFVRKLNSPLLSSGRCSQQSDFKSSQKSFDSSQEMYEDPLFPPENTSPELEMASRLYLESRNRYLNLYDSQNVYSLPYCVHPASETAAMIQDLMENVTTNVFETITSGTKTLTERLRTVTPVKSPDDRSLLSLKGEPFSVSEIDDSLQELTLRDATETDDFETDIVIKPKTKKRGTWTNQGASPTMSRSSTLPDVDETLRSGLELPSVIRNLHELVTSTVRQIMTTNDEAEAFVLLTYWINVYCSTVQQIHVNKRSSPLSAEDIQTDGPISISSVDSSYSHGSGGTCDSLHWDSNDIGFEPLTMSADISEQITKLFLQCFQSGVYSTGASTTTKSFSGLTKGDIIQHPCTPEGIKKLDLHYSQLIINDCGLLHYSNLINALDTLGCHYYILTWTALLEKITKDFDVVGSRPLPDILSDLDFTRSQRMSLLHRIVTSGSMKAFIHASSEIQNPSVIFDVIFLLHYVLAQSLESDAIARRLQFQKYLLQYLVELSQDRNLRKMYLDHWSSCSELQYDIISALLSTVDSSAFSCDCGMPLPRKRPIHLESFMECILTHDILNPKSTSELYQNLGYWKGFCSIMITYKVLPSKESFPYILQYCDLNLIEDAVDSLNASNLAVAFETLAVMTDADPSIIRCFRCKNKVVLPGNEEATTDGSSNYKFKFRVNGEPDYKTLSTCDLVDDRADEIHADQNMNGLLKGMTEGSSSSVLETSQTDSKSRQKSVGELWEVLIAQVLRRAKADVVLKLLQLVEDRIPPGVLSQKIYKWLILASMVDNKGSAFRWALLDALVGSKTKPFSKNVNNDLHSIHSSREGIREELHTESSKGFEDSDAPPSLETAICNDNELPPSPEPYSEKQCQQDQQFGYHWGVRAHVLQGICFCCHLRLATEALVLEGGITVFPCSHAYHAVCLAQRGHQCVLCVQNESQGRRRNSILYTV